MAIPITPLTILVVFYLYLLVRWQYVKRPLFFLLGAAGILFALCGEFFGLGVSTLVVEQVFTIIGTIVGFLGAVGGCFGGKLPVSIPGLEEQPPQ